MLVSAKNCSNNYLKACLYAYLGDFDNFYKYFGLIKVEQNEVMSPYIVRGIRFSLEFAEKLFNNMKTVTFNLHIYSAVSARYIMSNTNLDDINIKINVPLNIWYPNIPTVETCLYLLKFYKEDYKHQIAILSILNKWPDIYDMCDLDLDETELCTYKLKMYYKDEKENKDNIEYCYFIFGDYCFNYFKEHNAKGKKYFSTSIREIVLSSFIGVGQEESNIISADSFIEKNYDDELEVEDYNSLDNIGYCNWSSMELNLIKRERTLRTAIELNEFNVKYNIYNSICVLVNPQMYSHNLCKLSVTNYLVNCYYDKELLDKYKPFYLYSYRTPTLKICYSILQNHPYLRYNVFLIFAINDDFAEVEDYDIKPDIDLLDYARRSGSWKMYRELYTKAKECNMLYKHLDFDNETQYEKPLEIPFSCLDKYLKKKGHPMLITDARYFM